MADEFAVLKSVLRPLAYWYNQENLEEVAINRAGEIWLRLRGKRAYPWVAYKDEKLSKEYLVDLVHRLFMHKFREDTVLQELLVKILCMMTTILPEV